MHRRWTRWHMRSGNSGGLASCTNAKSICENRVLRGTFEHSLLNLETNMRSSTITKRTGSEGPYHDPYRYEETRIELQNGAYAVIHEGLREDITVKFRHGRKARTFGLNSQQGEG
jgi:hypothetical protein